MPANTRDQNQKGFPPRSSNGNKAPKQFTVSLGQERGVLGRREGKSGNRADPNPDGSRTPKK